MLQKKGPGLSSEKGSLHFPAPRPWASYGKPLFKPQLPHLFNGKATTHPSRSSGMFSKCYFPLLPQMETLSRQRTLPPGLEED